LQALSQTNYHSSVTPIIKNIQDFKREDAEGLVAYYQVILRATRQIHYQAYIEKNHELLEALRKEYGFKRE
jgi:molybdopterin/thiamine biosynthesis adenylyltransferase